MGVSSGSLYTLSPMGGDATSYEYAFVNASISALDDWVISVAVTTVDNRRRRLGVISKPTPVERMTTLTVQISHNFGMLTVPVVFHPLSGAEFYVGSGYTGGVATLSLGPLGDWRELLYSPVVAL